MRRAQSEINAISLCRDYGAERSPRPTGVCVNAVGRVAPSTAAIMIQRGNALSCDCGGLIEAALPARINDSADEHQAIVVSG